MSLYNHCNHLSHHLPPKHTIFRIRQWTKIRIQMITMNVNVNVNVVPWIPWNWSLDFQCPCFCCIQVEIVDEHSALKSWYHHLPSVFWNIITISFIQFHFLLFKILEDSVWMKKYDQKIQDTYFSCESNFLNLLSGSVFLECKTGSCFLYLEISWIIRMEGCLTKWWVKCVAGFSISWQSFGRF